MSLLDLYHRLRYEDTPMVLDINNVFAVSKERPRKGRSGHMYTPKRTQKFERLIADIAKTLNRQPYTCPVKVVVEVWEPIPVSYKGAKLMAARLGLISPPRGDLDNKVKAITDGLNGVAYVDDKQINCIRADRGYGASHKIHVVVSRNGLSNGEVERYVAGANS